MQFYLFPSTSRCFKSSILNGKINYFVKKYFNCYNWNMKNKHCIFFSLLLFFFSSSVTLADEFPVTNVDHTNLQTLSQQTKETRLSPELATYLKNQFPGPNNLKKIGAIHRYIKKTFTSQPEHGSLVAKRSVQQIFKDKTLSGCNDWGIVKTAILRVFQFPVVFMNAVGINWAKEFKTGASQNGFKGHVFLEVFLPSKKKWIVMDSVTDEYIKNYNYHDPIIPIPKTFANEEAYFVYRKGRDHWTQGVKSELDNREIIKKFALEYDLDSIVIKPKNVKKLPTKLKKKKTKTKKEKKQKTK